MAKGIQLAGGYGAGGINDALADLIAQKQIAEDRAEMQRQRALQERRQAMLDAQAAEERTFNRTRLTKQDERTERMDAEGREDKDARQAIEMATLFPGKVVGAETMARVPKYLHELIAKPKDAQLASRSIGGVAVAGDPNAGDIDIEEHEAVAPGSFELQLPVSERMRLAGERQTAAEAKAEKDRELAERRLTETERHNQTVEAIRASGAGRGGGGTLRKHTFTDPDTGETMEEWLTPDELRKRGPTKKPKTQKPVTGSERETLGFYRRAKDASDTLATPDKGGKTLEGRIAAQRTDKSLWGKYAPNPTQTTDQQLYRQAQRAFTEARLRKESGAAIPPEEYANDARTYFAEPGDAAETIAQKQRARQAVLDGLKFSAGKAFDEFYGESGGATGGNEVELIFDPKTGRAMPKER
jgi:sRNA-binding protein